MSDEEKQYNDNKGEFGANSNSDKLNHFDEDFFENFDNESNMEDADEDLLALLDMISAQDYNKPYEEDLLAVHPTEVNEEAYTSYNRKESEDIIALDENEYNHEVEVNNSINDEEDIDHLVDSILDLNKSQVPEKIHEVEETADENINDVGGIFSNVLSAVDLLDDKTEAEFAKLTQNFENQKQEEKQDKLGFFQRLLGKKKDQKKSVKNSVTKNEKSNVKKESKADNEKVKKIKVKNNKNIGSKSEPLSANDEEKVVSGKSNEPNVKKAKPEKKKAEKKKPEKKKAEKKKSVPKVKPTKKAKDIVNEITEDIEDFKVSKLAIIFIATFIILCSGFVSLGTNAYSYNLSIKNAKTSFERGRYTEAYYEICGLDVREQDKVTYDKIMTVMYINKEVNSYNNNLLMQKYPEALDSLLKGLERYDKYLNRAKELGIKKNLDSLKATILDELATNYGLTAKEAKKLNAIEDQSKYSIDVISIALEHFEKVTSE